jgi:predicted dehydrogenase
MKKREVNMVGKVRIGVIGVGFIGEYHVLSFQQLPEAEVVAICDVDEARVADIKERYKVAAAYTRYSEMLKKEALDGIMIATSDHLHRKPAEAVAASGIPFILEKPIATTLEDAEAIVNAAERASVTAVQGLSLRFHPTYAALRRRWDSGDFGTPHTAYFARIVNVSEARRFNGRCSVNQYIACHDFDFLLSLMGADVDSIYALRSDFRAYRATGEADSYFNLIKWSNGASAAVLETWGMPDAFPLVEDECLIIGTKGSAEKDRANGLRFATDEADESVPPDPHWDALDEYVGQAQAFVDTIQGKGQAGATLMDGLRAQKLVLAAEESTETGEPVEVDL